MSLREITYNIERILTKNRIVTETRIVTEHIEHLVHQYRSKGIAEYFSKTGQIDPSWVQDFGVLDTTKTESTGDPNITGFDCFLGRVKIPTVIMLPKDKGVYRISSASRTTKYFPTTPDRLFSFVKNSTRANHHYFFRTQDHLYISPYIGKIGIQLIIDNPLDGYRFSNEIFRLDEMVVDENYRLVEGVLSIRNKTLVVGDTFTFTGTAPFGDAIMEYANKKRRLTKEDVYPICNVLEDYIVMNILTKEFGVEGQKLADIKQDATDENQKIANERK